MIRQLTQIVAAAAIVFAMLLGVGFSEATAASSPVTVTGADVNIVAQWNESKDATGIYQAPAGLEIESASPVVNSQSRSSSSVVVSADKREARLNVHVRGSGEFWNKERGWYAGKLQIQMMPQ